MHENRETSSLTDRKTASPAGEGKSRTSGMYGGEESDGVVVPMKPSNKATEQSAGNASDQREGGEAACHDCVGSYNAARSKIHALQNLAALT